MIKHQEPHKSNQTLYVMIALGLGVLLGEILNLSFGGPGVAEKSSALLQITGILSVLTDIFMRLIKMIIAPLVFATLVVGMGKMGDGQTVGRVGAKAIAWFFSASILSLLLGMFLVNFFAPGEDLHLDLPEVGSDTGLHKSKPSLGGFVAHIFPTSIAEAMAQNEILQIVVFSMFFGVACAQLGELARPMIKLLDSLGHIMLKVTGYVMHFAPVAVFSAITSVIAKQGLGMLKSYGVFIG